VSKTGCTSVGDWLITRRISLVAACCSNACAKRASTVRVVLSDARRAFLAADGRDATFLFAGVAPRGTDLSSLVPASLPGDA
jgi:hypothetical protein